MIFFHDVYWTPPNTLHKHVHETRRFILIFTRILSLSHELVASVVAAGMEGRVGAGEGLARGHAGIALARVPDCAGVAPAGPRAGAVVEAVRFAREVVAAGSDKKNID